MPSKLTYALAVGAIVAGTVTTTLPGFPNYAHAGTQSQNQSTLSDKIGQLTNSIKKGILTSSVAQTAVKSALTYLIDRSYKNNLSGDVNGNRTLGIVALHGIENLMGTDKFGSTRGEYGKSLNVAFQAHQKAEDGYRIGGDGSPMATEDWMRQAVKSGKIDMTESQAAIIGKGYTQIVQSAKKMFKDRATLLDFMSHFEDAYTKVLAGYSNSDLGREKLGNFGKLLQAGIDSVDVLKGEYRELRERENELKKFHSALIVQLEEMGDSPNNVDNWNKTSDQANKIQLELGDVSFRAKQILYGALYGALENKLSYVVEFAERRRKEMGDESIDALGAGLNRARELLDKAILIQH
ncbi:hypothetical protein CMO93_04795 [Candidatus Woesearchaeota archaeon]|nr:hypothetical protein [Candidatus Woesearchaeota archaeon]|tara:strand:+ start:11567 stop:12622 length:1056 start_codon:yes stop_codon:yes gene_type:complete